MPGGSGSGTLAADTAALTIDALRAYLDDLTAANGLLADEEFSNERLTAARLRAIDRWNSTPPFRTSYEVLTFPSTYVYCWTRLAAAEALRSAAFNYARNQLPYNAGGVTVDDKNKSEIYVTLSQLEESEGVSLMHRIKLALDASQSFFYL